MQTAHTLVYNRRAAPRLAGWQLCFAVLFLCFVAADAADAAGKYVIKPPAAWVQPVSAPTTSAAASDTHSDLLYLLVDNQFRVTASSTERYYRQVRKVLAAAGLEEVSQLQFEFEPSYQQLVIHHARILRDGVTIDALKGQEIRVIQQESDLDQRIYNGTLSALIFLKDVRQGDVIDYAYSINGENPVINNRFFDNFLLAYSVPVEKLRWRLLFPTTRPLHLRNQNTQWQPLTTTTGGDTEYLWELHQAPTVEYEDSVPGWHPRLPMVQLSEFESWQQVARWAAPLYRLQQPLSAKLRQQLARWQEASEIPEERLLAALRFVQDEVRYLGVELGSYSHQPNQPSVIFERRFGDCKDKSLLLCAMLNALGIEAYPALVNTDARRALDGWQPTPFAFDHCITQAIIGGNVYWFDPTISYQRGKLWNFAGLAYERALVVREETAALTEIPRARLVVPSVEVKQIYRVKSDPQPASLQVTTIYHGEDANAMRYSLATQSLAALGKQYLNYYTEQDPSITADALPVVSDNPDANRLTVTETYTLPSFWQNDERQLYADYLYERLSKPSVKRRINPLALAYPFHIAQTIEVHLPESINIRNESATISDGYLSFFYRHSSQNKSVKLEYKLETLGESIPPADVAKHVKTIDSIIDSLSYQISGKGGVQPRLGAALSGFTDKLVILAWLVFFGPFVLFGGILMVKRLRARNRFDAFKDKFKTAPGMEPATPLLARSEAEMQAQLAAMRSQCGAPLAGLAAALNTQQVRFDGRQLTVITLRCESCGEIRDLYFALAEAPPENFT